MRWENIHYSKITFNVLKIFCIIFFPIEHMCIVIIVKVVSENEYLVCFNDIILLALLCMHRWKIFPLIFCSFHQPFSMRSIWIEMTLCKYTMRWRWMNFITSIVCLFSTFYSLSISLSLQLLMSISIFLDLSLSSFKFCPRSFLSFFVKLVQELIKNEGRWMISLSRSSLHCIVNGWISYENFDQVHIPIALFS